MNILVVDDHQVVRVGIKLLLEKWWPEVEVQEADSFSQVLKILLVQQIDLLLLDINIPDGDHLGMIDQIRLKQAEAKILIFSGYTEHLYAERYLNAGANGYLEKAAPEKEIKKAIEMVLDGQYYLSSSMKNELVNQLFDCRKLNSKAPLVRLSDREADVAHLLVKGLSVMDVSKRLNLHITTVSTYKTRVFKKLNISNLAELIEKFRLKRQANL